MRIGTLCGILAAICAAPVLAEDNWPQFRGTRGDGIVEAKDLPVEWGPEKNVKWATAVHGTEWSSPAGWGKQVWTSSATEDGHQLYAVCVDRDSGKIIHDLKLFDIDKPQYCIPFNSYGSPTP